MTERKTRKQKSYAPIRNGLTEALGELNPEVTPLYMYDRNGKLEKVDKFYTKSYRQDVDERELYKKDFRPYLTDDWNEACRNLKKGFGFKTNAELEEIRNRTTVDMFLCYEEKKNA
jgi:hypothetical protein